MSQHKMSKINNEVEIGVKTFRNDLSNLFGNHISYLFLVTFKKMTQRTLRIKHNTPYYSNYISNSVLVTLND